MDESLLCAPLVILCAREPAPFESTRFYAPGAPGCHRARHFRLQVWPNAFFLLILSACGWCDQISPRIPHF